MPLTLSAGFSSPGTTNVVRNNHITELFPTHIPFRNVGALSHKDFIALDCRPVSPVRPHQDIRIKSTPKRRKLPSRYQVAARS